MHRRLLQGTDKGRKSCLWCENKIGKENKMANKVENRISYAAAYALLKKYAVQNAITPEKFEKLNRLMAALYMCDPIVTTGKGKTPKKRKE